MVYGFGIDISTKLDAKYLSNALNDILNRCNYQGKFDMKINTKDELLIIFDTDGIKTVNMYNDERKKVAKKIKEIRKIEKYKIER